MTDRMPQIEGFAESCLSLIALDDSGFKSDRCTDDTCEQRGVGPCKSGSATLQGAEKSRVKSGGNLDDFGETVPELRRGKRAEHFRINNHQGRLVKGANQILPHDVIDTGLPANAAVHLGQKTRRHLDVLHPPQDSGGHKPGKIPHHSPPEGYNNAVAADTASQQHPGKRMIAFHRLRAFSGGNIHENRAQAGRHQKMMNLPSVEPPHVGVRYHKQGGSAMAFRENLRKPVQSARTNQHII